MYTKLLLSVMMMKRTSAIHTNTSEPGEGKKNDQRRFHIGYLPVRFL